MNAGSLARNDFFKAKTLCSRVALVVNMFGGLSCAAEGNIGTRNEKCLSFFAHETCEGRQLPFSSRREGGLLRASPPSLVAFEEVDVAFLSVSPNSRKWSWVSAPRQRGATRAHASPPLSSPTLSLLCGFWVQAQYPRRSKNKKKASWIGTSAQ